MRGHSRRRRAESDTVFRSFHRARRRHRLRIRLPVTVVIAAVIVVGAWVGIPSRAPARVDAAVASVTALAVAPVAQLAGGNPGTQSTEIDVADPAASGTGGTDASQPGASASPVPAHAAPAVLPDVPTPLYSIAVTARGHQAELDACQWVRMDVGAIAPIVGAHNFCHGDVVLAMDVGDVVTVTGTDLDGDYQVTGSRDARAGDVAAAATAGLAGDIIFQTCYWDDALGLRLVTAVKVDLSLPPIVVG